MRSRGQAGSPTYSSRRGHAYGGVDWLASQTENIVAAAVITAEAARTYTDHRMQRALAFVYSAASFAASAALSRAAADLRANSNCTMDCRRPSL
jgi:hypothetical protein